MIAHERATRARMIQMNVRDEQRRHVLPGHACGLETGGETRQRARWTGIDERHAAGTVEDAGGDHLRRTEKLQVDVGDARSKCVHDGSARRLRRYATTAMMTTTARANPPVRPIHRSSVSQL